MQIAFSGGRTSAYMLHHILEANGGLPERVEVTFQNTGREMPQTLDFVAGAGGHRGLDRQHRRAVQRPRGLSGGGVEKGQVGASIGCT